MNTDKKYRVAFTAIPGIGRVRLACLESYFNSLEEAWDAPLAEYRKSGLDTAAVRALSRYKSDIQPDALMETAEKLGISVLSSNKPEYPARLREIYDYPPVLYYKGAFQPRDEWCVAVVGTRRVSVYGRQVTDEITGELAANGITIVSGLARGVDTVAHRSAMRAGGRTIAVFACGLDTVYPAENERLAHEIIENGVLLSEYPVGMRPRAENFPRRNRILSGLSLGVLVTEADENSGAMITARFALEQNRDVMAVPGSIFSPNSRGTNGLIKDGARQVTSYTDVLEELNLATVTRQMEMKELLPDSDTEAKVINNLGSEPVHIDEVCRSTGLPVAEVSSTLAMMELKGMVKQVGSMNYVLAREMRMEYTVRVE